MRLDSVREVKAVLGERVLPSLEPQLREAAMLPVRAQRAERVHPGYASVALGVTQVGTDFRLAVRVQRRTLERSVAVAAITEEARGEVDVRYTGTITKRQDNTLRRRIRPVRIGVSVGHFAITAGTLGCFVRRPAEPDATFALSNNHVLADENSAERGDAVLQPGPVDGGRNPADRIGSLAAFEPIRFDGANLVDAALCRLEGVGADLDSLADGGGLQGLVPDPAAVDEPVGKLGRTTGRTSGVITAFELDNVVVAYDAGNARFDDQIEIESSGNGPFSLGGDSGSLIFTERTRSGVGLLFAGSDQGGANGQGLTYASPLQAALRALDAELLLGR